MFDDCFEQWKLGLLSDEKAARQCGMSHTTFRKYANLRLKEIGEQRKGIQRGVILPPNFTDVYLEWEQGDIGCSEAAKNVVLNITHSDTMQRKDTMKEWMQECSSIKGKKGFKVKKNRQVLLNEKLIVPTLAFEHNMTEKERKDLLKAMRTMFKLKIKQEIRPEEELMYTLTRQRELGMRKKRIKL